MMERHEADEQLRQAIIAHAKAYDTADPDDGDLLDQVIVISSWDAARHRRRLADRVHDAVSSAGRCSTTQRSGSAT